MDHDTVLSKVPAVTLTFWIIKILATTLGETGGDTVSMTMNLGYLAATGIFLAALAVEINALAAHRTHTAPRVNGHERGDGHGQLLFATKKAARAGRRSGHLLVTAAERQHRANAAQLLIFQPRLRSR